MDLPTTDPGSDLCTDSADENFQSLKSNLKNDKNGNLNIILIK